MTSSTGSALIRSNTPEAVADTSAISLSVVGRTGGAPAGSSSSAAGASSTSISSTLSPPVRIDAVASRARSPSRTALAQEVERGLGAVRAVEAKPAGPDR